MNCLNLKIISLFTLKALVFCDNELIKASVVFSVTSYGRLPGALLLVVSKDFVGDCLYACMQHSTCLTVNYHTPSRRCELVADLLYKNELIQDVGWLSYGHFESELISFTEFTMLYAAISDTTKWISLYFFIGIKILHSKKQVRGIKSGILEVSLISRIHLLCRYEDFNIKNRGKGSLVLSKHI